jgi:hypothetical protein
LLLFRMVDFAERAFNGDVAGFDCVGAHEANDANENSDRYDFDLHGISYLNSAKVSRRQARQVTFEFACHTGS